MSLEKVTVIMRTKNSQHDLEQALPALFSQDYPSFELLVVDSGSQDGTLDVLSRYPCRVERIRAEEYYPGPVLNRAVAMADTEIVVFQNSDVVPLRQDALRRLVEPFGDPEVKATFARQVPRPEAENWVRRDYSAAFPTSGVAPDWLPLSLPFAAMRRSAWRQQPFYDEAWGSEDTAWGERARQRGWSIRYVPEAVVMHSHNYTLRQLYGRKFIEGEADAFIYRRHATLAGSLSTALRASARDLLHHAKRRQVRDGAAAPVRRAVESWAHFRGHRLGERRLRVDDGDTSIGQRAVLSRYD
jgi:rhamnosyltransferase